MSGHLATERLSAYLDAELDERGLRLVEAHVQECPQCQHRLNGLRRVIEQLHGMPAATPPPLIVGRRVERAVTERWRARREEARRSRLQGRFELVQGPIWLGFAMIAALGILIVLFAHRLDRDASPTALVVPPAAAVERVEVGGRSFVLARDLWRQESLLAAGEAAIAQTPALSAEEGLARAPWLRDLIARAPVLLELDGEVVRVLTPAAPPGSPSDAGKSQRRPAGR